MDRAEGRWKFSSSSKEISFSSRISASFRIPAIRGALSNSASRPTEPSLASML